tara:strand:+ start:23979 stop:24842 length:864 start_codon:yes stop_codon:yes gene_type:complete
MLDTSTLNNPDVIKLATNNFINLKIDAETNYGQNLFEKFNGNGYPLVLFLDSNGNELDRFYGYIPAYEFIIKMQNVINGQDTFTYYLNEYNKNNHSAEILSSLADKYNDKGDTQRALALYMQLERTANLSKKDFDKAKYHIASLSLENDKLKPMLAYLNNYQIEEYFENAIYDLINYYKRKQENEAEITTYNKYLNQLHNNYNFLNKYSWRMAELNINLEDALLKVNHALQLLEKTATQYPDILDTKAEILWKMGKNNEAIKTINQAIDINPSSKYYKAQKEKFNNS